MITPIRFFWSKIMPISYDNYLSETEILEIFRERLNEAVTEINKIENFLENSLEGTVKKYVDNALVDIKNDIASIFKDIDAIENSIADIINDVSRLDYDVSDFKKQVNILTQRVNDMSDIINMFQQNINNQILSIKNELDFLDEKVMKELSLQKTIYQRMYSNMYHVLIVEMTEIVKNLSAENIKIVSPFTGKFEAITKIFDEIVEILYKTLTVTEYYLLQLSVDDYDGLNLTVIDYLRYGIGRDEIENYMTYDLTYKRTHDPMSSVYNLFNGINADMNNWDISVSEYDDIMSNYSVAEMDKDGYFILGGVYPNIYQNCIHLTGEPVDVVGNTSFDYVLYPDNDGVITQQDMFDSNSLNKLITDIRYSGLENHVSGNINTVISNLRINDDGYIEFHVDILSDVVTSDVSPEIMVEISGITETKIY